jgi:large repetitive protein
MPRYNGGFIGTDGLDAPDPPTDVTATAGDQQLSIAFTAPTDTGTSAITGFVAQVASSGDNYSAGSNTGSSSPIVVSSLSNGTSYTAKVWAINAYGTSAPSDASSAVAPALAQTAIIMTSSGSTVRTVNIATTGNGSAFGGAASQKQAGAGASSTRAVFGGGPSQSDTMSYYTFASAGNQTDFGNLSEGRTGTGAGSSNTRCLFMGGYASGGTSDTTDYITIASTGDASDFGNLSVAASEFYGTSNSVRALGVGGTSSGGSKLNDIQYFTIASTGDSTDFGDRTVTGAQIGSAANKTRALMAARDVTSNVVDYVTIASTGNATDFGDLTGDKLGTVATAGLTRAIFCGGLNGNASQEIDFFTIASTGNATDFGDLGVNALDSGATCLAHGGSSVGNA